MTWSGICRDGATRLVPEAPMVPGQPGRPSPVGGARLPPPKDPQEEHRMRSVAKVASLIALTVLVLAAFALQLAEF